VKDRDFLGYRFELAAAAGVSFFYSTPLFIIIVAHCHWRKKATRDSCAVCLENRLNGSIARDLVCREHTFLCFWLDIVFVSMWICQCENKVSE